MPVYWNHPSCPKWTQHGGFHYTDVTMSPMASKITRLTIVYSTVCSSRRSKKTSKRRVTGLCAGNSPVTGEFPAQRASNAEKVSIWWRHHPFYARSWTCLNKIYLYISWILCLILPSQAGFFKFWWQDIFMGFFKCCWQNIFMLYTKRLEQKMSNTVRFGFDNKVCICFQSHWERIVHWINDLIQFQNNTISATKQHNAPTNRIYTHHTNDEIWPISWQY